MKTLLPQRLLATATDKYLTPTHTFIDAQYRLIPPMKFGQDITFGARGRTRRTHDVGQYQPELKLRMQRLLKVFAANDTDKKAQKLFNAFLVRNNVVKLYEDPKFNAAVSAHENIDHFCEAAIGAPSLKGHEVGKTRIHQQLAKAGWDITRASPVNDLGVPALNIGSKAGGTGDFGNGLGVMVNGIQYAHIIATHYEHAPSAQEYRIGLTYIFYDVFGLDDEDLDEYGAQSTVWYETAAEMGITAWWQLQHMHNYAPLVTRMVVNRTFTVPTT